MDDLYIRAQLSAYKNRGVLPRDPTIAGCLYSSYLEDVMVDELIDELLPRGSYGSVSKVVEWMTGFKDDPTEAAVNLVATNEETLARNAQDDTPAVTIEVDQHVHQPFEEETPDLRINRFLKDAIERRGFREVWNKIFIDLGIEDVNFLLRTLIDIADQEGPTSRISLLVANMNRMFEREYEINQQIDKARLV